MRRHNGPGVGTLHNPGFVGGGPGQALEHLRKAEALFERDLSPPGHPTGGLAELRAWTGVAYTRGGRRGAAAAAFRSALELEPAYMWVRDVLLPGVGSGL